MANSARRATRIGNAGFVAVTALGCLAIGRALPAQLQLLSSTRVALLTAGLVFLVAVGWLAIARPLTAFAFAFALIAIARVEPAPVDAVFALLILGAALTEHVRPRVPPFVTLPLVGFALVSILSATNAVDLHRAVKFEATTIYLIVLAVWLSWAFVHAGRVHVAVKLYVVVAAITGTLGAIALYLPLPGTHSFVYVGGGRAQVLFKDPNVYAAFLVPAAIILLEELTTPRILRWRRSVVGAAFALVTLGVVVGYSRAAWLDYVVAVAALIAVQALRRGGLRHAFRSVGVLVVSGCIGLAVLIATGSIRFLEERSHLQGYDNQRFSNQTSAFDDMLRHVFGYGPGQTEALLPISTHSTFLRAAFEQGLLGLTTLVLVFGGTLVCALLLVRRRLEFNGVGTAALLGIWLGQIANSFFIDTLHWRHLWILAGLIWCGYSLTPNRRPVAVGP